MALTLTDDRLTVTVDKNPTGQGFTGYVDTVPGQCFDDGTHSRSLHWHSGKKPEFMASLQSMIVDEQIVECDDPECDQCHGDE